MKKMAFVLIASMTFSSMAFANTYVKCGESVDLMADTVSGYELEISSENDIYSGPVGENWNLKVDEAGNWLDVNKNITARSFKDADDNTVIEVSIKQGQSVTGPVGIKYKLIGLYDDEPVLEKYTMGGFAGSVKIGTFQCQSAND
jgi:hypothetical protein